jgi:hypothetical protein
MADEPNIAIIDPGSGVDVFADEALDFDIVNGTLRIRFGIARPDKPTLPAQEQLVHIGRLIMPVVSAQRLCIGLYNSLKNAGLDPIATVGGSPEQTKQ